MAIQEIIVSNIYILATEPIKKVKDRFWFDTTNNILKRYDGTTWKPISVSSDDIVVLSSGNKVSLTSYLNTQIAALAEGIDSKQDKLNFYSEVSGDTPSATISVANIKFNGSVAEGYGTTASGESSHAEGDGTNASSWCSHAEGGGTTASGNNSHAEGFGSTASGNYSHAEGQSTTASGEDSHAEGISTYASSDYQHAQGKYNIEDTGNKYADIIGNGSSSSARSNAATVSWNGISWSQTDVRAGGTDQDSATHSLAAKQNSTDAALNTTDKTIVGAINELRKSIIGAFDPITDVWTATTASSLTSIITNPTYANTPGRILISPKITNTGAIKVGDNITDISKAFPLYPDQIVSFTFSDINNFKVAADSVNDGFNYVIEFSVISPYTSQSI